MLIPAKTKYRKALKGRIKGNTGNGFILSNGEYGLKALSAARINSKQIEAARRVISRTLNKSGKIWIKVFPNIPVSKKPIEVRMGKGKGAVEEWVVRVKPGKLLFEVGGSVTKEIAFEAFRKASSKLPVKCRAVFMDE